MSPCFFVSDLHGNIAKYETLFDHIQKEKPTALFLGGDILPSGIYAFTRDKDKPTDFLSDFLVPKFASLKKTLKSNYPEVFLILGNDDGKMVEPEILKVAESGLWHYMHMKNSQLGNTPIYGYSYIPPSPFLLKDWEKYDVSRYTDPGSVSPEEGKHSRQIPEHHIKYGTIQKDLVQLFGEADLSNSIILFHSPPYQTNLDRAALDGKMIDHVPLDLNIGSIAIKRFIEEKQPLLTLHGHVHESATLTGSWQDKIGRTLSFTAAHEGKELALIRFDSENPEKSGRELL